MVCQPILFGGLGAEQITGETQGIHTETVHSFAAAQDQCHPPTAEQQVVGLQGLIGGFWVPKPRGSAELQVSRKQVRHIGRASAPVLDEAASAQGV